jgi:hypothetical protein
LRQLNKISEEVRSAEYKRLRRARVALLAHGFLASAAFSVASSCAWAFAA